MRTTRYIISRSPLTAVLLLTVGCGLTGERDADPGTAPPARAARYSSPQEAFAAAQAAARRKDWRTLINCFDPRDRDAMVSGTIMAMAFATLGPAGRADPRKTKEVEAFYEAYGIAAIVKEGRDGDAMMRRICASLADKDAFIVEGTAWLDRNGHATVGVDGTLADVRIEGDRAVGHRRIDVNGEERTDYAVFKRFEGSWRLQYGLGPDDVE